MMKSKEECFEMDFPEDGEDFVGNMFDIYSKGFDSGRSQIAKQEREIAVKKALEVASEKATTETQKRLVKDHVLNSLYQEGIRMTFTVVDKQSILSLNDEIIATLNK